MEIIFVAALGASFQEVMYWYGKRFIIFKNGIASDPKGFYVYIGIVILVVIGSSLGTYVWFYDREFRPPLPDILVFGAAFPALFKVMVKSAVPKEDKVILGSKNKVYETVKKYLG